MDTITLRNTLVDILENKKVSQYVLERLFDLMDDGHKQFAYAYMLGIQKDLTSNQLDVLDQLDFQDEMYQYIELVSEYGFDEEYTKKLLSITNDIVAADGDIISGYELRCIYLEAYKQGLRGDDLNRILEIPSRLWSKYLTLYTEHKPSTKDLEFASKLKTVSGYKAFSMFLMLQLPEEYKVLFSEYKEIHIYMLLDYIAGKGMLSLISMRYYLDKVAATDSSIPLEDITFDKTQGDDIQYIRNLIEEKQGLLYGQKYTTILSNFLY